MILFIDSRKRRISKINSLRFQRRMFFQRTNFIKSCFADHIGRFEERRNCCIHVTRLHFRRLRSSQLHQLTSAWVGAGAATGAATATAMGGSSDSCRGSDEDSSNSCSTVAAAIEAARAAAGATTEDRSRGSMGTGAAASMGQRQQRPWGQQQHQREQYGGSSSGTSRWGSISSGSSSRGGISSRGSSSRDSISRGSRGHQQQQQHGQPQHHHHCSCLGSVVLPFHLAKVSLFLDACSCKAYIPQTRENISPDVSFRKHGSWQMLLSC